MYIINKVIQEVENKEKISVQYIYVLLKGVEDDLKSFEAFLCLQNSLLHVSKQQSNFIITKNGLP